MENVIIRKIEKEDIPDIVDIQIDGWRTAYKGIIDDKYLNQMNKEEKINRMKQNYNQNGFIVAELEGKVVGFCRYIDNNSFSPQIMNADCELTALYVKPGFKYNGIGTMLFEYVKKEFIAKNKKKMILWCLKDNEPSKRFYKKMGGTIIDEKLLEVGEKEYQEVCFSYKLNI
ncbi:MAG: GNAT family N-acetyltransferase [Clostridia bacterium]|nr:GNAT family N-acetyltransferase [Clostridia bacterium]